MRVQSHPRHVDGELCGGVALPLPARGTIVSFYDWYCDLPIASPQVWGEQTDVPESADWFNSGYIILRGSNVPMTRTPDAHFLAEARYRGTRVVGVSPDYAEYVKFADEWVPVNPGTDGALAMAMTHVILGEFYAERRIPYFADYARQYTDLPFLVQLRPRGDGYVLDRFLRESDLEGRAGSNADWKLVVCDEGSGQLMVPQGGIGSRWDGSGRWNLKLEDASSGESIRPTLTLLDCADQTVPVDLPLFDSGTPRLVPVRPCQRAATFSATRRPTAAAMPAEWWKGAGGSGSGGTASSPTTKTSGRPSASKPVDTGMRPPRSVRLSTAAAGCGRTPPVQTIVAAGTAMSLSNINASFHCPDIPPTRLRQGGAGDRGNDRAGETQPECRSDRAASQTDRQKRQEAPAQASPGVVHEVFGGGAQPGRVEFPQPDAHDADRTAPEVDGQQCPKQRPQPERGAQGGTPAEQVGSISEQGDDGERHRGDAPTADVRHRTCRHRTAKQCRISDEEDLRHPSWGEAMHLGEERGLIEHQRIVDVKDAR